MVNFSKTIHPAATGLSGLPSSLQCGHNQLVQLRLEKRWPALSWSETTVEAAGTRWFVRWQGVETALPQLRALDVEVRRQKSDPAPLATLRTWVTPP
ncbi:MAG: type II secretion system protein GspI [Klebsiella sp.]|uniref:type II secretion system protein GspI n=1 Tax=Klebsiella sp. TaxID=576 RepID=UPI0039E4D07E